MRFFFTNKKVFPPQQPIHANVPELRDAEIAAIYYGQRVGGDFYDFLRVNPSRVMFGLLDVAGRHQENVGIISAAQEVFRSAAPKLFAREDINEADAMAELSLKLNRAILKSAHGVRSCPAFAACYNEALGTVCYTNAGHTPALLRDDSGVTLLGATGLPLGLFSHVMHDASICALRPGAALLLVSRGMVEGKSDGEEYGLQRVAETFQRVPVDSAKEICIALLDGVRQYMGTPPTHDDVTALALVRAGVASGTSAGR